MAAVIWNKLLTLPATLTPSAFYAVKGSNSMFKLYLSDASGTPYGLTTVEALVNSVNGADGDVTLNLSLDSSGVLGITGGNTVNLDSRYFKTTDSLPWAQLSGVPTTVAGYGITDAYTKSQVDAITGALSNLQTTTQTNLVAAINELVTAINNGMRTPQPIDCSANPNYPASQAGDTYKVTVAGKIGGASGQVVQVNDQIICTATNGGGDQATVGASFFIIQGNVDSATTSVQGLGRIATQAEVNAGTEDKAWVTPVTLATLLGANYYTKTQVDAKGYLTAEADTLQTVTNRGNSTPYPATFSAGTVRQVAVGVSSGSVYGVTTDIGTIAGGFASGLVIQADNSDGTKKIGAAIGINGSNNNLNYSFWAADGTDISNIYAGTNSLRLYANGSLWYGTPPVFGGAVTKFLGLSSDGHIIGTRTAAQVLSDIGGLANISSGSDWNTPDSTVKAQLFATPTNAPIVSNMSGMYFPLTTNYGSEIAFRANKGYLRTLENGVWGDWLKIATTDQITGLETDPVWTAAKAAATNISGAWTFVNGVSANNFVKIASADGNEGFYASPYAYFGMKFGSGNPLIGFNVKPTNGSDAWAPYTTAAPSSLVQLTNTGSLQIYTAPANQTAGTFSTFWGTPKTVATTDLLSSYLPLAGGTVTGSIYTPDSSGIGASNGNFTILTRDGGTGHIMVAYNAKEDSSNNWSQGSTSVPSSALDINAGGLYYYSAAAGQASGSASAFWATKEQIATRTWVATQIPAVPTLQQVTTQGGTTDKPISLTNTGIGLVVNGGTSVPNAIQFGSAGGNGTGGYIQGVQNTSPGYGVWTGSNAYYDGANWIQPRGTSVGSHIFGITHHKEFTWQYAAPNGTNGAMITPTEIMNLNSLGNLTVSGTVIANGVTDAATGSVNIAVFDSNKILRYRTPSELRSDIGAQAAGSYLTSESDPIFSVSAAADIEATDISNWNDAFAASHAALTLGTIKSGLSLAGQVLSLALATASSDGAMSKTDKTKLDGIDEDANNYTLPTATGSVLGGVKIGTNINISSGVISVPGATTSVSGVMSAADKAKLDGIAAGANNYSLPIASGSALGGIKVGSGLSIDANGVLTNNNGTAYTLPVATSAVLGGIKVGATLNIANGVLNGNKATNVALGMVMAGDNMAVDANGAITMQWAAVEW